MNKMLIDITQSISIKNNITTQYKENYMKIFRELYFRGNPDQLQNFTNDIRKYVASDWEYGRSDRYGSSWIYFDYSGDKVDNARVCISTGEYIQQCELKVNNIVPMEKNQLSIEEYNAVLQKFYEDIIIPYTASNHEVYITEPSSDEFNPLTVISHEALRKLEAFCNGANKSTGSSHPCDQERWFDFICQTVDDGKIFDYSTLADFLQDESYWGEKEPDCPGAMELSAWDEEHAYQLASEYENACVLLQYYKKTRG